MAIALSDEDIRAVGDMALCLYALEETYRQMAAGSAVNGPRVDLLTPRQPVQIKGQLAPSCHMLKTMSAATPRYASIRFLTDILAWPTVGDARRRERANPSRKTSVTRGLILLFDVESGDLLAILAEGWIRNMRVGASAGLAARYLARPGSRRIGLLGTGFMARANLEAISLVVPGCTAKAYSPSSEHREAFCNEMQGRLDIALEPVQSAEEAVRGADLVIAATNSLRPVVDQSWLKPGTHLTCVRHCEFPESLYHAIDRVVLNCKDNTGPFKAIGTGEVGNSVPDFIASDYEEGYPSPTDPFWRQVPDLSDLIAGRAAGRQGDREITCFDNSVGWGLQFTSVAASVYESARSRGLGKEIPDDLLPGLFA